MSQSLPFKGRVIQLLAREPLKGGTIENATLESIAGPDFIVGVLVDYGRSVPDVRTGKVLWYALDEIVGIAEFDDLEDARSSYTEFQRQKQSSS